jgi:hypothetical protein
VDNRKQGASFPLGGGALSFIGECFSRELVSFFESREQAEAAMRAAIHRELEQLFGSVASHNSEAKVQGTPPQVFAE